MDKSIVDLALDNDHHIGDAGRPDRSVQRRLEPLQHLRLARLVQGHDVEEALLAMLLLDRRDGSGDLLRRERIERVRRRRFDNGTHRFRLSIPEKYFVGVRI
jgi:hypothetical protein